MITAGTVGRKHIFRTPEHLDAVQDTLFELAEGFDWRLQAWALFSNHYHFVVTAGENPGHLPELISTLHVDVSKTVNRLDRQEGRQVFFQFWDTRLTFQTSYFSRVHYTHCNAVKHGLVLNARDYPWCSAGWFEKTAAPGLYRTITSFKIDSVKVLDGFEPVFPLRGS